MNKSPKTINGLMKHLRNQNKVNIKGSKQKSQLTTQGYYHGYKGYRFYKTANKRLPINDYEEINQTIIYDSELKNLLFDKIMFIETALKNIALDVIINELHSDNIDILYTKGVTSYKNAPAYFNNKQKNEAQKDLLSLQANIQKHIFEAYSKKDPKIIHFFNHKKHKYLPLWAIFEVLTMGNFGYLIKSLTFDLRDKISNRIGIDINIDSNRTILYSFIFTLKDLRNSIAHNGVIYDCRFNRVNHSNSMKKFLCLKTNLNKINFEQFIDYIALISYFLKALKVNNLEIKLFIMSYKEFTNVYLGKVRKTITNLTIAKGWDIALRKMEAKIMLQK